MFTKLEAFKVLATATPVQAHLGGGPQLDAVRAALMLTALKNGNTTQPQSRRPSSILARTRTFLLIIIVIYFVAAALTLTRVPSATRTWAEGRSSMRCVLSR